MSYARHIGRVGALAVALGVGVAVASSPGIAYADPSEGGSGESSASTSSTSSTSADSSAGTGASAPDRKPSPRVSVGAKKNNDKAAAKAAAKPAETSADAESSTNGVSDQDTPSTVGDEAAPVAEAETPPVDTPSVESPPVDTPPVESPPADVPPLQEDVSVLVPAAGDSADQAAPNGSSSTQPTTKAPTSAVDPTVTEAVAEANDVDPEPQAFTLVSVDDAPAKRSVNQSSTSATALTTAVPTPAVPQPPGTLIGVVTEFVASVLNPLLSLAQGSPIQMPFLSAVLTLVRNEFERILAPRTANVAAQQTVSLITDTAPLADPTRPRVLVIGVDGANLSRILADDYNQNFITLMGNSTTAASSIVGHTTVSNPSWTAILTGVWGERTGVINNVFTPWTYNTWPTVFNQLESIDRDIQTMAIGNWNVINAIAAAGSIPADENVFVDRVAGDTHWLATDDMVAALTVEAIRGLSAPTPNFLFSYFVGVDENGHAYGGASTEYRDAIRNMDDNLGDILAELAIREALGEDWTVIVVTDHGHQPQVGFGHGFQSPDETSTFVIVEGSDFGDGLINLQYEIVDITPTVVKIFGGTPRAGSDGVPLMDLAAGDVNPSDLQQALNDVIAKNGYPDIVTNVALGVRTIFATVPYYIFNLGNDIGSMLPDILALPVKIVFDGLYVITNVPAQIVAWLTGVSGASLFPLLPPAPPMFPSAEEMILPDSVIVLRCGAPGAVAESYCGAANVA